MYRAGMIADRIGLNADLKASPNLEIIRGRNQKRENFALIKDFLLVVN
jgi:hypothetical protein